MNWEIFKNIIKGIFRKPNKKEWLDRLVKNLETQSLKDVNLPFRIEELKDTGFKVKILGLYAFVSLNHMPWTYNCASSWKSISPKLIGKIFYCRVHSVNKDPSLWIIIDGKVPQFRKTELMIGESYKGIIIEKSKYGVFVDIGYHFDWKCGSFVGLLHRLQFESIELLSNCSIGDEIEICYQGANEEGRLLYCQTNEIFEWNNDIPQSLLGQIVWTQVVRKGDENTPRFLIHGKYKGELIISKTVPLFSSRKALKEAINELKDGEIIHCEIIDFSNLRRILDLKWIPELYAKITERKDIRDENFIENNIDHDTIQKMMKVRDEIESRE
jgi:ribosomal protein S1